MFLDEYPDFEMIRKYDYTKIGFYYYVDSVFDINLIQLKIIYRKLLDDCIIDNLCLENY